MLVQAYDTEALAITCALQQKAKTFYTHELDLRDRYGYPPHAGLVRFLWRGPDLASVQTVANEHGAVIRAAAGELPVLGPSEAGLAYLKGQHRWHCLVKASSRGVAQQFLDRLLADPKSLKEKKGVKIRSSRPSSCLR